MSINTIKAILINLLIAFLFGIIGLFLGLFLNESYLGLQAPEAILDKRSFVAVEHMHNFSYIGGLIGLCIAIIWQLFSLKKNIKTN